MPTDHRAALASIKTFLQLIAYLRDEMGWPIARDSFEDVDDLFYDFTADELGIDPKTAAKIESIKRLKPLSTRQPWGIFFVKFEPKKLPVVALRSILSHVALKKRASANSADRTAWAADDLLFVSNYGEGSERQITFAHFSQPEAKTDLPTLKVLGWDNLNTSLHLDDVAEKLTTNLAWPIDDKDIDGWRKNWCAAFTVGLGEPTKTSRDLSVRLAMLARRIRDLIKTKLAIETDRGPLTKLMKAFQMSLVHDLDADGFADMYAQTISYGLLSARIADPHKKTVDDFAGHMRTNPFLRELMETFLKVGGRRGKADGAGIDFDELGVSEIVQLLDDANMEAVVRDFGDKNPQEDPVIHFYELFLKEYDAKKRMQRGVFYTPRPVVSYIVRSVDELLRTEFGLEDGLADTTTWGEMATRYKDLMIPDGTSPDHAFVQILDPATGTGTFLVEVIDVINRTLVAKWKLQRLTDTQQRAAWNDYVPQHLLPRLHAYELLMAPYAIAHMKIGLKLAETGYRFGTEERARIYLTNAVEPWVKQLPLIGFDALAHEAAAVNEIKRHKRFTVVIGNPPYSYESINNGPWIAGLISDYMRVDGVALDERNPRGLQDDYVKFVRLAQFTLDQTGNGVLGFITNHGFLSNPTFRGMRQSIQSSLDSVFALDLHGNANRGERAPDGGVDENVFDILQGVSIICGTKSTETTQKGFAHSDLFGVCDSKYKFLLAHSTASTTWRRFKPQGPFYLLVFRELDLQSEYNSGVSISEIFPLKSVGISTSRDSLCIQFSPKAMFDVIERFSSLPNEKAREEFRLGPDVAEWSIALAKHDLKDSGVSKELVTGVCYRPFDVRFTYFTGHSRGFHSRPRPEVMRHMLDGTNLALCSNRQVNNEFRHIFVTRHIGDGNAVSLASRERTYLFPLFLQREESGVELRLTSKREANYKAAFLKQLAHIMGLSQSPNGMPAGLTPEDIFHYAYAVFHSPGYRSRYAEFLKIDFPRLPLTESLELFHALAKCGGELVALHLLESSKLDQPITEFIGGRNPEVEKPSWSKNTVWVDKAKTTGFKGVREDVWKFHIGGYQVCAKWLKDRKGRKLSKADIDHYQEIVVALNETIGLMQEIDVVIEQHGGWPGAFVKAENK